MHVVNSPSKSANRCLLIKYLITLINQKFLWYLWLRVLSWKRIWQEIMFCFRNFKISVKPSHPFYMGVPLGSCLSLPGFHRAPFRITCSLYIIGTWSTVCYVINPLVTKMVWSRWPDNFYWSWSFFFCMFMDSTVPAKKNKTKKTWYWGQMSQ